MHRSGHNMMDTKTCSKCGDEKPLNEFCAHKTTRDRRGVRCNACETERARARYAADREGRKAKSAAWREANPERHMQNVAAWRTAHPEKHKASVRKARAKWARAHPEKVNARNSLRHATKMNAVPKWANTFFIGEAYDLARRRTEATGVEWEVDHIIPLRSEMVCGLHVENNLRVIPALHNQQKGNRHWPDMP